MGLSLAGQIAAALGYLTPVQGALLQEAIDVAAILNALRALTGGIAPPRVAPHAARTDSRRKPRRRKPRLTGQGANRNQPSPRRRPFRPHAGV
jgi:hypothetical protein